MKLRALELEQFRKFSRPMLLDGLRDGVNVLCAPNEHGKSTLMAAIRAVLFEKHASKTDAIRSYQPRLGGAAPRVSLEFEFGGASHRIEKRFMLRPHARLLSGGVTFEAEAAEERLAALLGIEAAGRGARDAARQAASIWGALLVDQGDSLQQATLGEQARATLGECLRAELGQASGGAAINRTIRQVQAQLAERVDGRGQPRDRFRAAIAEAERARLEGETLRRRRAELAQDLDALAEKRRALGRHDDPDVEAKARQALDAARRHREALLGQRDRQGRAEGAAVLARNERDRIAELIARRARLDAELAAGDRALAGCGAAEAEAKQRLEAAAAALERGRAAQRQAALQADRAADALRAARRRQEAQGRRADHAAARDRLGEADRLARRIDTLSAELQRLRPDRDGMVALRQASMLDRADRAALLAQATRVSLRLSLPAVLEQDGLAPAMLPPGPALLELTGPATLRIEGVGEIGVAPAAGDRDRLLAAAGDSARRLRALLAEADCADLDAAEQAHAARGEVESSVADAKRALAALAGRDGIAALRAREASLRPAGDGADDVPDDAADLAGAVAEAQAALDRAQRAERDAGAALGAPGAVRDAAATALTRAELERGAREAEQARLAAELAQAREREDDAALSARLLAAEALLSDRLLALAAVAEAAPDGTVPLADARIERLEQARRNTEAERGRLREEIARLDARIAAEQGAGLDEAIETALRQQQAAERSVAADRREVAVLTLLRDTLAEAERGARERFVQPLVGRIGPYLRALFPGAALALDDGFLVDGLSRPGDDGGGGEPEAFGSLSHGTREQVAVLARLAFADMLAASGRPAFVVLDDALAFADAARLDRMFDIINEAGQRLQILLLTCREEIAGGLGGHRVRLREAAGAGG